jgi:predicted dehydrogenase
MDPRCDRRAAVAQQFNIKTFSSVSELDEANDFDLCLICTPPDTHALWLHWAIKARTHAFVEASVVLDDLESINAEAISSGIKILPSATLCFHPAIKEIFGAIKSGKLGNTSNLIVHSGQYLPYWHKYEPVADYYVSNPATGAAREIVPFELTWIVELFGFPSDVSCMKGKTINIPGAENIDDTYNLLLNFGSHFASLTVDVVSRDATRYIEIIGDRAHLKWNWSENTLVITYNDEDAPELISFEQPENAHGYNSNISDQWYIDEMKAVLQSVISDTPFVNNLEKDIKVLKILLSAEADAKSAASIMY